MMEKHPSSSKYDYSEHSDIHAPVNGEVRWDRMLWFLVSLISVGIAFIVMYVPRS